MEVPRCRSRSRLRQRQQIGVSCSYPPESPPIMFPFIIQSPQLPMCCCIQLTMSLHQPGEAVVEIEVREPLFIHCRQTESIDEALPHIIGPVICRFWSCWPIQSAIVEHAALAELLPRLEADLPAHSVQTRCTDASCCWSVTPELSLLKKMIPMMMSTTTARPIGMSHMAWRLTSDVPLGASVSVPFTLSWSGRALGFGRAIGPPGRGAASVPTSLLRRLVPAAIGVSHTTGYTGDPPPGLGIRGILPGCKPDKEVCGGVESVIRESRPSGR